MPTEASRPVPETSERRSTKGSAYLAIGALVVTALVAAYVVAGTPGLHIQVAKAPPVASATGGTAQD